MNTIKILSLSTLFVLLFAQCSKDAPPKKDFEGTYVQEDQMGRPAINSILVPSARKDEFNTTHMPVMNAAYYSDILTMLRTLNPNYSRNLLGQNDSTFVGLLATDVLKLSTTGVTTFYDGSNIMTGRKLSDDVMDFELLLIYGGPTGTDNPNLKFDNVLVNDKSFLNNFPYLASSH